MGSKNILLLSLLSSLIWLSCNFDTDPQIQNHDGQQPNIVIIFLDDAGWGDFQPFNETRYPTPNVKRLAEEGRSFMNFRFYYTKQ